MILISNSDAGQINTFTLSELEKDILRYKEISPVIYQYDSPAALEYELKMRTSIVESAVALNSSGVTFATFNNSRCNEHLWSRSENGGFQLRSGVLPSDGISNIFQHGLFYAFECATAIVILWYKAILDVISTETFNVHFKNLFLRDWHYDSDLRIISTNNKYEAYPGDVLYFKNPDHAPESPEWQGENVVMLAEDVYYGHGIGIGTSEKMISSLNKTRKPGSLISASLTELVSHPDFEYLRKLSPRGNHLVVQYKQLENSIVARIGTKTYIY
jgi:protein-glutamine gamma-glutamyltransferase